MNEIAWAVGSKLKWVNCPTHSFLLSIIQAIRFNLIAHETFKMFFLQ